MGSGLMSGDFAPREFNPDDTSDFSVQTIDAGKIVERKPSFWQRNQNKFLWATVIALSIFLFGGSLLGWTAGSKVDKVSAYQEANTSPAYQVRYDTLGKEVINTYYNGGEMPVLLSKNVTAPGEGMTSDDISEGQTNLMKVSDIAYQYGIKYYPQVGEDWVRKNQEGFPDPYREVLYYSALMNGTPVQISISLMVPQKSPAGDGGKMLPTLEDNPSVEVAPSVSSTESPADGNPSGAGLTPADIKNKDIPDQLTKFAEAWASGDSSALRDMVNDGTNRVYTSPGGMSLDGEVDIRWAYNQKFEDDPNDYIVARISFPVSQNREGTKTVDGERTSTEVKFGFQQSMDVLIKLDKGSIPRVVSWGGYWKELTPYSVGKSPEKAAQESQEEGSSSSSSTQSSEEEDDGSQDYSDTESDSGSESTSSPSSTTKGSGE